MSFNDRNGSFISSDRFGRKKPLLIALADDFKSHQCIFGFLSWMVRKLKREFSTLLGPELFKSISRVFTDGYEQNNRQNNIDTVLKKAHYFFFIFK